MAYQFVREPLNEEEADRMYSACSTQKEKLIVWTLLETGLRVGELCALSDNNIMWQQRSIRVLGKGGFHGKASKKRVVPMSDKVFVLLSQYFSINEEWFVKKSMAQKIVKAVANKAKITKPVSAHILRHTFACSALQKGLSIAALQKMLGHDNIATTQIYLNLTDVHLTEEFQRKW